MNRRKLARGSRHVKIDDGPCNNVEERLELEGMMLSENAGLSGTGVLFQLKYRQATQTRWVKSK